MPRGRRCGSSRPGVGVLIYDQENQVPARLGSLAFQAPSTAAEFACEEILSPTGDLHEAAATLFAKMRRLDEAGLDMIIAEQVPERGLGIAIMDRLRKAAAQHV
ncbi:MAG: Sua5 family C-terminal domain-containing protein [Chthoniobacter sp.]